MRLSRKAKALLVRINDNSEASLRLEKRNATAAQELVAAGLAELIHQSTGGADVCLNSKGVEEARSIKQ